MKRLGRAGDRSILTVASMLTSLGLPTATVAGNENGRKRDAHLRSDDFLASDFGMTWNQMGIASMKNTIGVHVFSRADTRDRCHIVHDAVRGSGGVVSHTPAPISHLEGRSLDEEDRRARFGGRYGLAHCRHA